MSNVEAIKNKLAAAPAAKPNPNTIGGMMTLYKDQIQAALPRHMTSDRMARIVLTECRRTPALMKCEPKSLFGAVIQCSQLGLEPGGALGHAYLLPFRNNKTGASDVQLIVGYRGMIDLARRSGQIISITARAVHANDQFRYEFGLEETMKHIPDESGNPGALTHVYAVAKLKDGGVQFEVMSRAEVENIRKQSKAGNSGPWVSHFDEMAKKTVIRRLFKYLPVSIELQRAVGLDEQADAGVHQQNSAVLDGEYMEVEDEPASDASDAPPANEPSSGVTYATVLDAIQKATSLDTLDIATDLIGEVTDAGQRAELSAEAKAKRAKLEG